jgi:methylmalonyl-CoA mutase cobalamin-binding domain/chain
MGERFGNGDLFLPELMLAANASDQAVAVLEPELAKSGGKRDKLGKFLIASVKGDIHDIGKNIVALLLKSNGFEVTDIGINNSSEDILKAAKEIQADIIGLSALLTTTMPEMKAFIDVLHESGERDNFKVIVGGAPVTRAFADEIGADGYGADASRAVEISKKMMA